MDIVVAFIKLFGGIALLLYGMNILSTHLKKLSGGKLEQVLQSVTDNKFKGLITGIIITVATQSSSTTTVIVVGLVNAEFLKLTNAIPIIMGANIGTTITSQILRLTSLNGNSLLVFLTPEVLSPIAILIGFLLLEISKNKKAKTVGQMLVGIGLLFLGMITMVDVASDFSKWPILSDILATLSNPILGVLAGAIVTLIVQSSAATVGILQALSTTGITTYSSAIPIILGQNIGTCGTSIISSIGGSKNAKRAAAVHLYFNLIGTIIFLIVIYSYQYLVGFPFWESSINMGQIANFHTLFNVVSTILLFGFTGFIEKLTMLTIKDENEKEDDENYLTVLNTLEERVAKIPNLAIANSTNVIEKMGELSEKNFRRSIENLSKFEIKNFEKIQEREDAIDKLDKEVASFLVNLWQKDLSDQESITITSLLKIEAEYEKLGDYAYRISKIAENMTEQHSQFSENAYHNIDVLFNITDKAILTTGKVFKEKNLELVIDIWALRDLSELYREIFKNDHIQRLKEGKCNVESGIAFLELLSIFEKIMNYCLNISIATSNYMTNKKFVTEQDFRKELYKTKADILKDKLNEYSYTYSI